ncbi:MAG: hypothetical protein NXI10_13210 [bacterium]|nr:hypothetical protein [bacterium]
MDYFIEELIYSQLRYYGSLLSGVIILLSSLYLFPLVQALYAYSKKKWLEKQFAAIPSSGEGETKFRESLLQAAEPGQSYPIYKIFKFYLASTGIAAFIVGAFIVMLPDDLGPDAMDWLVFIPGIIGGGIYFLYVAAFQGQGLYREIAGVFGFAGFIITAIAAYEQHEMGEWLRADILAFVILGVGGLIIWHLKSILVSYMYMIAVAIAGATVYFFLEDNWLNFLPHLLWVFAVAILYVWIPKLKEAKDIGPKETIFGIIFGFMILSLTTTQLSAGSGLLIPAMAVVLPALYVFSKTYFYKADTIIGRPIEVVVIVIVLISAAGLITNAGMTNASDSIYLFEEYSFEKQVSYFILLGIIAGTFFIYNRDFNESTAEINPSIALLPVVGFIITYIIGEYTGHYIMTLLLFGVAYLYVRKGFELRDSLRVALGALTFIYALIIKINDIGQEDLYSEKESMGATIMLYGMIFLGVMIYLRSQWQVSGGASESKTTQKESVDILDRSNDAPTIDSEEKE